MAITAQPIFYLDDINGSDTARTSLTSVNFAWSAGTSKMRANKTAHGLTTGAVVDITGSTGLNSQWIITYVDADNFDLDESTNISNTSGTVNPRGGSSYADAWKTHGNGATSARLANQGKVKVVKSPAPYSIGSCTWTDTSKTVTLPSALTLTVDNCEVMWTNAGADATLSRQPVSTDAKQGSYCMQFTMDAAPQASILQAYYPLGSAVDFSSMQNLTFWIKNEAALSANNFAICLCSDTAGATVVDTFDIPAINVLARWIPLTIARTGGGNLGASIQSIALYTGSAAPTASKYIRLDNILACATNGLNLQSLISKNSLETGGTEGWYGIQSIVGTTILLDNSSQTKSDAGEGYSGTTETVASYARETLKLYQAGTSNYATGTTTSLNVISTNGTIERILEFSYGWNSSNDTQDGETIYDCLCGQGRGFYASARSFIKFDKVSCVRAYDDLYFTTLTNSNVIVSVVGNSVQGINLASACNNNVMVINNCNNSTVTGLSVNTSNNNIITFTNINSNNTSASYNINVNYSNNNTFICGNVKNSSYGISLDGSNNRFINLNTADNSTAALTVYSGVNYFYNWTPAESTEVAWSANYLGARIFSEKHDGTEDNDLQFAELSTSFKQTTEKPADASFAWKVSPTSNVRRSYYKDPISLGVYRVVANKLVTVKMRILKSNANINGGLFVSKYDLDLGADVTATSTNTTDWTDGNSLLTMTFTPTRKGCFELFGQVWYPDNSSTHTYSVYFAHPLAESGVILTVSQAD